MLLLHHHSIKDGEKRMAGFLIFFHSCTSLFLNRERLTAIGQLRRQSPHYHQGLMKQIALGALIASQSSVVIWVELRVWRGIQGWLDSLQSAVRNRQETFYQLVCRRQNGTSTAPAMHKAGQRHRSRMLSPSLRWLLLCYNSISIIKVRLLFALSGLNHGQLSYLVVDKQVWVEYEANDFSFSSQAKVIIYEEGIYEVH